MKLEIKHIAPYLPYELQIEVLNFKCDYVGIRQSVVEGFYMINDDFYVTYKGGSTGKGIADFKPLLLPLSETPNHVIENAGYKNIELLTIDIISGNIPTIIYNSFIKNHYDVFGLIPAGLALHKNRI